MARASSPSPAARWHWTCGAGGAARVVPKKPRIVLLAAREQGWRNLMTLVSRAYLETPDGGAARHARLALRTERWPHCADRRAGGPLDKALVAGHGDVAASRLDQLTAIYGDRLYVELQRHNWDPERIAEPGLLDLAYAKGLPLVAANEPFFGAQSDYNAHDALIAIAESKLLSEGDRRG